MNRKSVVALSFLMLMASFVAAFYFLDQVTLLFFLSIVTVLGILCSILATGVGFACMIAFIVGYGFYVVFTSWNQHWGLTSQLVKIFIQSTVSLGAASVWMLMYTFKKNEEEAVQLQKEVNRLRKYEPVDGILTWNEFIERTKLLFVGLQRRKEEGYCLLFEYNAEGVRYKDRIANEKLSQQVLKTVRMNYDLVGKLSENQLVVFLSNTNTEGVRVVISRFWQNVANEAVLHSENISIEMEELPTKWDMFEEKWKRVSKGVFAS